jgi:hypothetical protein
MAQGDEWLRIAKARAAFFPSWFISAHVFLMRATGSGRGWHGTGGRALVAFALHFEIVSALYINLFVGVLPWAAYTVFLVLSWKLVRCCLPLSPPLRPQRRLLTRLREKTRGNAALLQDAAPLLSAASCSAAPALRVLLSAHPALFSRVRRSCSRGARTAVRSPATEATWRAALRRSRHRVAPS